jgi:putative acetyltransferase
MVIVRAETAKDYDSVFRVNELAFGRDNEARLVEVVRKTEFFIPGLSLVAVKGVEVIGHILISMIHVDTKEGKTPVLGLAPIAVLPEFQRQGIGSELIRKGIKESRRLKHQAIVLIGHPEYYPRFGFEPARAKGLETAYPVPDEVFLALELYPGALDGISGMIIHPPAFNDV